MTSTWTTRERARTSAAVALVAILGAVLMLGVMSPSTAQGEPAPIAVTGLTDRAAFTDDVAVQIKNKFADRHLQ
jgi:hypothetical protein